MSRKLEEPKHRREIRLTDEQLEKFTLLGGQKWVVRQIDRAPRPDPNRHPYDGDFTVPARKPYGTITP